MSHVNDPEIDNMYDEEENSEKMYQREKELQEDNKDNLLNFMKEHGFSVPTGEYGERDIFVKDQYMVSQYDINYLYLNEFGKPAKKIKVKDLDAETPKKSNPLYEYLLSINAKLDRGLNDCTVSFKNKYGQDVEIYLYHEDLDISNIDDKDYRKFKHVIPQELDATKENVERIYNTKSRLKDSIAIFTLCEIMDLQVWACVRSTHPNLHNCYAICALDKPSQRCSSWTLSL